MFKIFLASLLLCLSTSLQLSYAAQPANLRSSPRAGTAFSCTFLLHFFVLCVLFLEGDCHVLTLLSTTSFPHLRSDRCSSCWACFAPILSLGSFSVPCQPFHLSWTSWCRFLLPHSLSPHLVDRPPCITILPLRTRPSGYLLRLTQVPFFPLLWS